MAWKINSADFQPTSEVVVDINGKQIKLFKGSMRQQETLLHWNITKNYAEDIFPMWLKDLSILPLSDYGIAPSTGNLNLNNNLDKIKVNNGYSWVRYIHIVTSFCTHCTHSALIVG